MFDQVEQAAPMYRPSQTQERGIEPGYRPPYIQDRGIEPTTRRLIYLGGLAGLAILAGVSAYSLSGHSGADTVPVVKPDERPIKVKPENPGGMPVTPEAQQDDPSHSHLAPATEEPNPLALLTIHDPQKIPVTPLALTPPPQHLKSYAVQLSSAKTEADAQATWEKMVKKMPELLGQRRALFQKTNESGASQWRLRTGGFADSAQAKAFCEKLKAKGGQCSVVES